MPTLTKLYSMQEASQHNTKDDCWIVVDGKVYDVSAYVDEHPGGDDVILATTGKDATDDFEDAGHSKDARELMETMFIGELDTDVDTSASASAEHDNQPIGYLQKLMTMTTQYWAVPAAVMGISVVVAVLYLRRK